MRVTGSTKPAFVAAEHLPNRKGCVEFRSRLLFITRRVFTTAVCTEKLNPDVVAMKSAKDRI